MFKIRLENLLKTISDNECIYVKNEKNVYYYSGFSGEGFLLISKTSKVIVTDFRYIYDAKKSEKYGFEVFNIRDGIENAIDKSFSILYIEGDNVTFNEYEKLKQKFPQAEVVSKNMFENTRDIKTDEEISNIKKASQIAESAFENILKLIDCNVTEKQLAAEFEYLVKKNGASGVSFNTIVASGVNSSMPHAVPTDKKINKFDFITFDFGCVYNHYCSDMTRTVAFGGATDKMKNIYSIVLKAQLEGLKNVNEGIKCSLVDKSARDIIDKEGYKEQFGHGLGHGVGLNVHEKPNLSPRSDAVLKNNMVVTVEPGIYLEGEFGVRIEDLVVVKDKNPYILTKFEKNLIII